MKPRALVRVFNLILCFDTNKSDVELEAASLKLINEINTFLSEKNPTEIPQIHFEDAKKKIKIGIKIYQPKDHIDEE